jgi:hypothetical protein
MTDAKPEMLSVEVRGGGWVANGTAVLGPYPALCSSDPQLGFLLIKHAL